jgi:eukaryotic-like serine/threonine-protein kinase
MSEIISVPSITKDYNFTLRMIGEGSYAKVFRYRDEFYNKYFVLKRAKNDLDDKELERFKREFDVMNELKSPYVLEVYRYDDKKTNIIWNMQMRH